MIKRGMPPLMLEKRTKNKRGVSPIIATILLVAITVVIAAVLYVLVSGYLKGTGSAPLSFQLTGSPHYAVKAGVYYVNFTTTSASSGMTTNNFGLKFVDVNGNIVAFTWAKLTNPAGVVISTFTPGTASWNNNTALASGDGMDFSTGAINTQSSGDTIQAFGLGGSSVSGGYSAGL